MAAAHIAFDLRFVASKLDADLFRVVSVEGHEAISRPFEHRVRVRTRDGAPLLLGDLDALMEGTATLGFGASAEHPIHGVVREVSLLPVGSQERGVEYELRLVPRLADLALTRGSWIHLDKTPAEILTASFALAGDGALKEGEDFELALDGRYLPLEYTVQYEESLLDFISRQAEHRGIFYYFEHGTDKERVVFGDTNDKLATLEGFEEIHVDPSNRALTEAVISIAMRQRIVEKRVSLREYNYRIPSVSLVTPLVEVDAAGIGDVHLTGDHFGTPDEGNALALVRSQERFAQKRRVHARTTVRGLRSGHRFTLAGAEAENLGLAGEYIVVSAAHHYAADDAREDARPYWNEVELQPYEAAFRPARVTPKPVITGVMHAVIDSESDDDEVHVPVDEWGRYKVVMPFDVAGKKGGKSSCWIRMATSAGGSGWGFAQGLHVGTEVVIAHIGGDPDRPVIAGAVMNFEQPAAVRRENANQLVMASRQGISIRLSDA